MVLRWVEIHDEWLHLFRSACVIRLSVFGVEQWRSCKLQDLTLQRHRAGLCPSAVHCGRIRGDPRECTLVDSLVELAYHPIYTLIHRVAWHLVVGFAGLQGVVHDRNAAVVLEGVEEGINHEAACLGLETVFLVLCHVGLWSSIYIVDEDMCGTDAVPLKLLVVRVERTVETVRAVGSGGHGAGVILSIYGCTVPEEVPAVCQRVHLSCVGVA